MKNFAILLNPKNKYNKAVFKILNSLKKEYNFCYLENGEIYPKFIKKTDENIDCLLVFGGDGTILYAWKYALEYDIPILAINIGTLGFLSEIVLVELSESLEKVKKGKFSIQKRMLLEAQVKRKKKIIATELILNDAVIYRGHNAKLIEVEFYNNDDFVMCCRADGFLISTPTGSTGYNLSTGGPILFPTMDSVVVNAINPHILTIRPMIFLAKDKFLFKINKSGQEIMLQIDGKNICSLQNQDKIFVTIAKVKVKFISFKNRTFFQILQNKFHMGRINTKKNR